LAETEQRTRAASIRFAARATIGGLAALTGLEILWELLLAPTPGLRWLALKAVPLALLMPKVARGQRKAKQWLALLLPWYAAEAIVRAMTEPGRHAFVAGMAALIALATFMAVLVWFRVERRQG
jgi:uncharacterized membrane protein